MCIKNYTASAEYTRICTYTRADTHILLEQVSKRLKSWKYLPPCCANSIARQRRKDKTGKTEEIKFSTIWLEREGEEFPTKLRKKFHFATTNTRINFLYYRIPYFHAMSAESRGGGRCNITNFIRNPKFSFFANKVCPKNRASIFSLFEIFFRLYIPKKILAHSKAGSNYCAHLWSTDAKNESLPLSA